MEALPRMIFRSITDRSEIDLLISRSAKQEASARWVAGLLERGESRLQWCRMAVSRDDELLAAHAMDSWSFDRDPGDTPTFVTLLGHMDEAAAVALLNHDLRASGAATVDARLVLDADAPAGLLTLREGQQRVLEAAGFTVEVDRVRLGWTKPVALTPSRPRETGRLAFRPATTLAENDLIEMFAAVSDGSADHAMIIDRAEHGRRQEAAIRLGQVRRRKHEDDWFVVGVDGSGVPVGYVQSALDADDLAFLAEIGVVESQRGHRYVDELLAYGTRVLAGRGETRIRAYTDAANRAMRAAFARGGYAETGSRRDFRRRVPPKPSNVAAL
jgi:RimJ/RimL family protein N-acetyltransferase